jgi:hypothetical protein
LSWGSVTSPTVDLTNCVNPKLRFWCMFETESADLDYDKRFIEVSKDGFVTKVLTCQATVNGSVNISDCTWLGEWHQHEVALDPAWGVVQIRFRFNSVDDLFNVWVGWFVDDYEVVCDSVNSPPPPPPPGVGVGTSVTELGGGTGTGSGTGTGTGTGSGSGASSSGGGLLKSGVKGGRCGGSAGGAGGAGLFAILVALLGMVAIRTRG